MKKTVVVICMLCCALLHVAAYAQNPVTLTGTITNQKSNESLTAVSVTVKGTNAGTYTDDRGHFKITVNHALPLTLVISSVGYSTKEIEVSSAATPVTLALEPNFVLGQEVVVAASRRAENIQESPVTIERLGAANIRNAPAVSYYDAVGSLKGVDVVASSLTFKTITTRGFGGSGNLRFNQLVDGMDNQAPGLNFSVGGVIGLTELDVDNMELLSGASSALYGPGGMNGTMLITSKNPFKYQGFSAQVKQGVMHVDSHERKPAPYYNVSMRWAQKITDKFAFKITGEYTETKDWLANDDRDYNRTTSSNPNGEVKSGTRTSDPNYDGVNIYGDETTQSLPVIYQGVAAAIPPAGLGALNGILAANPNLTLQQFNAVVAGNPQLAPLAPYAPVIYGNAKNYYAGQNVSRTGYNEQDVVDPKTYNLKIAGGLYYKITDAVEASLSGYWGTGNTVYTGSDRYSLKNLKMGQYKLEFKGKDWYARAYTTQEDAGKSFNATITTRLFNEAWKASSVWYPTYMGAYTTALAAGLPSTDAHNAARGVADQGRPAGPVYDNPLFKQIASTPISQGGGLFLDKSSLYMVEGQYNLTRLLKLEDKGTDVLVGASWKRYVLNSEGTLFADTAGRININETGAYAQVSQKIFKDILKLTASGRYDKNTNFKGRFTPRISAVVKVAEDQHVRLSYQTAYRFPSTQNQWINLVVGGGTYLIGGLPALQNFYNLNNNPGYTLPSVQAYGAALAAGDPNAGSKLVPYKFGEFKAESSTSYEVGYRATFFKHFLVDVYGYYGQYKNFISSQVLLRSKSASPIGLLSSSTRDVFSTTVNSPGKVKTYGWGLSAEYLLGGNFSVNGNVYSDDISDVPQGLVTYFNAPRYRYNLGFGNSGFGYGNHFGFNVLFRWQDSFDYAGTFGQGRVPNFTTLDAQVSYKFPKIKSIVKLGGTNLINKYYRTAWGNPEIGGLYYVSFGYNVF
ncbi:TonB-dependent receptor [Deminuibacter soli]|uniref:TonB-dependent receptor n=1 Tax=Deminuibacter soli TaxID=2291815 RepID=A0A3E1NLY6_9BACT|nr:TonB-dependent receptor [Deminuibacter soli]RFM28950.1 TonB-dependent receptor [Deminuibacter soli]